MRNKIPDLVFLLVLLFLSTSLVPAKTRNVEQLQIEFPQHGFVSFQPTLRWEEGLITGNGTIGGLIFGNPGQEKVIISHEKLFMPKYRPTKAPPLYKYLDEIRKLTLAGRGEEAAELALKAGEEVGINDLIWTDPLIPACQIEVEVIEKDSVLNYARSVNYETGETITAWQTDKGLFHRKMFVSRADNVGVLKFDSPNKSALNFKFRLGQLPVNEEELAFDYNDLIKDVSSTIKGNKIVYTTQFQKNGKVR